MHEREFRLVVQGLLGKYDGTPLLSRWQEAISFGAGIEATDYWIRDSGHIMNIVWLNHDGIRDITMVNYPAPVEHLVEDEGLENAEELENDEEEIAADEEGSENDDEEETDRSSTESMFNFILLRNISSIEVREGDNIAFRMGIGASGSKLVHVIPNGGTGNIGHLYWVADSPTEGDELEHFLTSVLSAYLYSR